MWETSCQHNIDNLTGLWRLMGASRQQDSGLLCSQGWPRRCWLDWEQRADYARTALPQQVPPGYLCPIWDAGEASAAIEQQLLAAGYRLGLQQRAMVLPLTEPPCAPEEGQLQLHRVIEPGSAETWSALCARAFGYAIDACVIAGLIAQPDVEVLLATRNGSAVATALLYHSGPVSGVHQVGVPPEYQGQGIARALMQQILPRAHARGSQALYLQASAAGEPLYVKLGFVAQCWIRSYRRD